MDSFKNEEEEKIIGTIVKIDNEGLHGISDSPPRITLKTLCLVSTPPTVPSQGIASFTTVLDGVTISPNSNNNNTTASKDRYEMNSQNEVSGVTPANVNLEGVTRLEGVTPAAQTNGETIKCTLKESVSIYLMNVDPTRGSTTLDGVTVTYTPKQTTSGSQSNADSHPVTPETNNQGNINGISPVTSTLDGITVIPDTNKHSDACTTLSAASTLDAITETPVNNKQGNKQGNAHMTRAAASVLDSIAETPVHDTLVTPDSNKQSAKDATLPDLVNSRITSPALHSPTLDTQTANIQSNAGEFDFPALSSDDENNAASQRPLAHKTVNPTEQVESQLTEEEDDAISALLSLSKSIASDNSQDAIENSELLPIGKSIVDAVPVPIRLGVNDVNKEIDKLKSASVNSVTTPNQHTEVTTTIITNQDGSVETKTSIQSKANRSPLSPKLTSPEDDSPGSPRGNFKLRSYKLKKKAAKPRKYPCKSCTLVKNSIQELNDHHKRKHEQVMCGTCNKIFDAPLQLNRHMYEHYEKTLNCDKCSRSFSPSRVN